jgi:hypothetical protein
MVVIVGGTGSAGNVDGASVSMKGGAGIGSGNGAAATFSGGNAGVVGAGGTLTLSGGSGGSALGNGGNILLLPGTVTSGTVGYVGVGTSTPKAILDVNGTSATNASIESATSYTNSGAAYTIPDANSNIRRITLSANTTITLPSFATPTGKVWTLTVMVKQDGTGSKTLAWGVPSGDSILWDQSASGPTPNTTASKITIYQFTKPSDETTWYASMVWKQN